MRILRSPDEGTVSNADPPADAGVSEPEPAPAEKPGTEEPDVQEPEPELDLDSLPEGLRQTARTWLEKQADKRAEEKANAIVGGRMNWLPKEEREIYEKDHNAFKNIKARADQADKLSREIEDLRRQPRPEVPARKEAPKPEPPADDFEQDLAGLDKDFEHNDVEKKWVRAIIAKAESRAEKKFATRLADMERRFYGMMDSHHATRMEIERVTSDPDYSDPELGESIQIEVAGEMFLAREANKPISLGEALKRVQNRWTPLKAKLKGQNGAAAKTPSPAPPAKPAEPAKARTIPSLGDMNGRTSPKGSEPELDVHDDDQLLAEFRKDPAVRAHYDRRP